MDNVNLLILYYAFEFYELCKIFMIFLFFLRFDECKNYENNPCSDFCDNFKNFVMTLKVYKKSHILKSFKAKMVFGRILSTFLLRKQQ